MTQSQFENFIGILAIIIILLWIIRDIGEEVTTKYSPPFNASSKLFRGLATQGRKCTRSAGTAVYWYDAETETYYLSCEEKKDD